MAITTSENRKKHIHGLALAAKQIALEERKREDANYENVMAYFRRKAKATVKEGGRSDFEVRK